jgi:3-hydroxyisobutyrate dehydrogenase-like beta-hydroxyacid dehydrogenase
MYVGQNMVKGVHAPQFPLVHCQKDMQFALDLGKEVHNKIHTPTHTLSLSPHTYDFCLCFLYQSLTPSQTALPLPVCESANNVYKQAVPLHGDKDMSAIFETAKKQ